MNEASCVNFTGYAGNYMSNYSSSKSGKNASIKIIDIGASIHKSHDYNLF